MTYAMRRSRQALAQEVCADILSNGSSGVLALSDKNNHPYAVPLSYVYVNDTLYFHSAKAGHKVDLIQENPSASFCVIADDHVVPERFTTYYRSVIVFGHIRMVEDADEAHRAIILLGRKYAPNESQAALEQEIDSTWSTLTIFAMHIDAVTGKESFELTKAGEE
ncbi:MAG: pyridoxamine 5'-phosphate oxidase family protein [Peptococcaceae bacterium]|nr:pyridoxamine 5'-phosphate oxidase family protein [Peptococcaceae bacterium]